MKITSHRELEVWQEAMDLAMEIFHLSKKFPADERFSLTDQIRRSARSVAANLAEAWRKRRYEAAFISKLNDAEGEAAETQTHLDIAHRCGYLLAAALQTLDSRYETLLARIVTMSSQSEKWVLGPHSRRGEQVTKGQGEGGQWGQGESGTGRSGEEKTRGQGDKAKGGNSPLPTLSSSPLPNGPRS